MTIPYEKVKASLSLIPNGAKIAAVLDATADVCGLSGDELVGPSRKQTHFNARLIATKICRDRLGASTPAIGWAMGRRYHTTVINMLASWQRLAFPEMYAAMQEICARVGLDEEEQLDGKP